MTKPVLEIKNLNVQYKTKGTVFNKEKVVNAVNDLNLSVEKGEIIERGSHEELLEQKGRYYRLYTGQFELE